MWRLYYQNHLTFSSTDGPWLAAPPWGVMGLAVLTPELGYAQELSFNLIQNRHEIDIGKLDVTEDDLVAAAFGRESPNGRSSGETLGLLARLERDRRAAAQGFDQTSGFVDDEGRLRLQGLGNL